MAPKNTGYFPLTNNPVTGRNLDYVYHPQIFPGSIVFWDAQTQKIETRCQPVRIGILFWHISAHRKAIHAKEKQLDFSKRNFAHEWTDNPGPYHVGT